jgi:hypothetical protein
METRNGLNSVHSSSAAVINSCGRLHSDYL